MPNVCYTRQVVKRQGQLVKRLRRRPLTAETGVRFPYWLLSARQITLYKFILLCYNSYGQLVKRLRRRPLTAETGVRFPYWLLSAKADYIYSTLYVGYNSYGQLVKRLRRRPLTAETGVRFPYWLLSKETSIFKGLKMLVFVFHAHFHTVSTHFYNFFR